MSNLELAQKMSDYSATRKRAAAGLARRNNFSSTLTALDRTISGIDLRVLIETSQSIVQGIVEGMSSNNEELVTYNKMVNAMLPSISRDADTIRLVSDTPLEEAATDESIVRLSGYNYHALAHVMHKDDTKNSYSVRNMSKLSDSVAFSHGVRLMVSEYSADGFHRLSIDREHVRELYTAMNCMSAEYNLLRRYPSIAPYLVESFAGRTRVFSDYVAEHLPYKHFGGDEYRDIYYALIYPSIAPRIYLPSDIRRAARQNYINVRMSRESRIGANADVARNRAVKGADRIEEITQRLSKTNLSVSSDWDDAEDRYTALEHDLVDLLCEVIPIITYESTNDWYSFCIDAMNIYGCASQDSIEKADAHVPDFGIGAEVQENTTSTSASDDGDAPGDTPEQQGTGGDLDQNGDEQNSGEQNSGETDTQSDTGSGSPDSDDNSSGSSDSDDRQEDATDTDNNKLGDGAGTGGDIADNIETENLDRMFGAARHDVLNNSVVQQDIANKRKMMSGNTQRHSASHARRLRTKNVGTVTPEMRLLSKRVAQEFTKITDDADPGYNRRQPHGKLNVQRVMSGDYDFENIFDQWDEGRSETTDLEVVFMIDTSGSMSYSIDEVCRALWVLKYGIEQSSNTSSITAIAYSGDFAIIVDPGEKESSAKYRIIGAVGGTSPAEALQTAFGILYNSNKKNKLMVNLTDGEWSDKAASDQVIKMMNECGINTGLMYYDNLYHRDTLDNHNCRVVSSVHNMGDILTFLRSILRDTMH